MPDSPAASSRTSRYFLMSGLLHAFYWMDESLQNHLRAAGYPPVSRTQSLVMANIADGVTRPSEIARRLGVSRQAMQQLLAQMQERKLIELVPDPADARAKIVRYSPEGRDIGEVTLRALEHIDREIAKRLGRDALQALRRILVERDWGEPVSATPQDLQPARDAGTPAVETVVRNTPRGRRR